MGAQRRGTHGIREATERHEAIHCERLDRRLYIVSAITVRSRTRATAPTPGAATGLAPTSSGLPEGAVVV